PRAAPPAHDLDRARRDRLPLAEPGHPEASGIQPAATHARGRWARGEGVAKGALENDRPRRTRGAPGAALAGKPRVPVAPAVLVGAVQEARRTAGRARGDLARREAAVRLLLAA